MATLVKISVNDEIAKVLERLKQRYPTLDSPELFKLGLAELDRKAEQERRKAWAESLPILELSEEEKASLDEAFAELDAGKGEVMTVEAFMAEVTED